jgi:hypothetical protein
MTEFLYVYSNKTINYEIYINQKETTLPFASAKVVNKFSYLNKNRLTQRNSKTITLLVIYSHNVKNIGSLIIPVLAL